MGLPFTPELAQAIEEHLELVDTALAPWESERAYLNFSERPADGERFFAEATHDRLREIRERRDPSELFRANQRIRPAGGDW